MKKTNRLYKLVENNEGEIIIVAMGTLQNVLEELGNKIELGDEVYELDIAEDMTVEEINEEIANSVGISWYSMRIIWLGG